MKEIAVYGNEEAARILQEIQAVVPELIHPALGRLLTQSSSLRIDIQPAGDRVLFSLPHRGLFQYWARLDETGLAVSLSFGAQSDRNLTPHERQLIFTYRPDPTDAASTFCLSGVDVFWTPESGIGVRGGGRRWDNYFHTPRTFHTEGLAPYVSLRQAGYPSFSSPWQYLNTQEPGLHIAPKGYGLTGQFTAGVSPTPFWAPWKCKVAKQ